jgi:uncharacterized protein
MPGAARPVDSYSIKRIEALYGFVRQRRSKAALIDGALFEQCPKAGRASPPADQRTTKRTAPRRDSSAGCSRSGRPWDALARGAQAEEGRGGCRCGGELEQVKAELLARSSAEGDTPWLIAQLLDYHRREAKPEWWAWFEHKKFDEHQLIRSRVTLGGLEPFGDPVPEKRSLVYTMKFPAGSQDRRRLRGSGGQQLSGQGRR